MSPQPVWLGTESAVCPCGHWSPGLAACRTAVGEGGRSRMEQPEVEGKGDTNQKLALEISGFNSMAA